MFSVRIWFFCDHFLAGGPGAIHLIFFRGAIAPGFPDDSLSSPPSHSSGGTASKSRRLAAPFSSFHYSILGGAQGRYVSMFFRALSGWLPFLLPLPILLGVRHHKVQAPRLSSILFCFSGCFRLFPVVSGCFRLFPMRSGCFLVVFGSFATPSLLGAQGPYISFYSGCYRARVSR